MKLYPSQLKEIRLLIKNKQINAIFFYGPNRGYVSKIINFLAKLDNYLITEVNYSELNSSKLQIILNRSNFFGQKELVKINCGNLALNNQIKELLKISDNVNFPLFISHEANSSSAIKKYFETTKELAAIACYFDNPLSIEKIIQNRCAEENITINSQALTYLKNYLQIDHNFIDNEINKLIFYLKYEDKKEISMDFIEKIISLDKEGSTEKLAFFLAKKDLKNFLKESEKLTENQISEMIIIRSLIRYYTNLYIVLLKKIKSCSFDKAIAELSPPLFFKYIPDFKILLDILPVKEVAHIMHILCDAETIIKTNSGNFSFLHHIYQKRNFL